MKNIIVQSLIASNQIAVMEDNKLTELWIEDNIQKSIRSNIYRGIVKNVKIGIEAAFVDIGFEKMAYLPIKSTDEIKNGMEIMVQINKEAIGTKGAKLTREISLSGRYLVLIPSNDRITISNKIKDEKERFRLKKIVNSFNKEKLGIIIRTEAVGCELEELKSDFEELINRYQEILKSFKLGMGAKLLYKESDLHVKYIKDNINDDIDKIILNDENQYLELKDIIKKIDKRYVEKIILEKDKDIFDLYKVSKEIKKSLSKKVWLKSGGYLIIEKTEALTVIDVNTGKFTGNSVTREQTTYKTNLEAANEISRQIKLRDISGIIIVDFIDLRDKKNKEDLINQLKKNLQKDKRKSEVMGMTKLGLIEIARRREKDSIDSYYFRDCNLCNDDKLDSINSILDNIEKETMRIKQHTNYNNINVLLSPYIYDEITKNYNSYIIEISKKYHTNIIISRNTDDYCKDLTINCN